MHDRHDDFSDDLLGQVPERPAEPIPDDISAVPTHLQPTIELPVTGGRPAEQVATAPPVVEPPADPARVAHPAAPVVPTAPAADAPAAQVAGSSQTAPASPDAAAELLSQAPVWNEAPTPRGNRRKLIIIGAGLAVLVLMAAIAPFALPKKAKQAPKPVTMQLPRVLETSSTLDASGTSSFFTSSTPPAQLATPGIDPMFDPNAATDWTKDVSDATPSHYYVWCGSKTVTYDGPRDANGIIMVKYAALANPVYNPQTIANYSIHWYESWLHTRDATAHAEFLKHAQWLRDKGMDGKGRFVFSFNDPDRRSVRAPWYSVMAQGIGISALTRAYVDTGDASYLAAAKRALAPYTKDIRKGGVTSGGGKWLEEYPDGYHVLNGSLFGMFGLHDLYRVTGDKTAKRILTTTTTHLARNLDKYESHGAVLYEVAPDHFAHPLYYGLQNRQLRALSVITGDDRFAARVRRWEASFHAYPDPVISLPASAPTSKGRATIVKGKVKYVFPGYYPSSTQVVVKVASGGTSFGSIVGRVDFDKKTGAFSYTTGAYDAETTLQFEVEGQPVSAPSGFVYQQKASARTTVKFVKPTIGKARVLDPLGTPNADGWTDQIRFKYVLGASESQATLRVYDQKGKLRATVPGRTKQGQQWYQANGEWTLTYDLKDTSGTALPDGVYGYTIEARNRSGSDSRSGVFYVSHAVKPPAASRGSAPSLSSLVVYTNPIRPSEGGTSGRTDIGFTCSTKSWITCEFFASDGRRVRAHTLNMKGGAGRNFLLWDGRDDAGKVVPDGTYRFYVLASSGGSSPKTAFASGVVRVE